MASYVVRFSVKNVVSWEEKNDDDISSVEHTFHLMKNSRDSEWYLREQLTSA